MSFQNLLSLSLVKIFFNYINLLIIYYYVNLNYFINLLINNIINIFQIEFSQSDAQKYISDEEYEQLNQWLECETDQSQRKQILYDLSVNQIDFQVFNKYNRLDFGTAGLRGAISYGYNKMNEVVIMQTANGLVKYLKSHFTQEEINQSNIVIAHDARHKSDVFSDITAVIFAKNNIKVNYFKQLSPTPYAAFFTKYFKSLLGVMVTASHNPSIYNGYKVYQQEGVQINSPTDEYIQEAILESLDIENYMLNYKQELDNMIKNKNQYLTILDENSPITEEYYKQITQSLCIDKKLNSHISFNVEYSTMFGSGNKAFPRMMKSFGFNLQEISPAERFCIPDPNFGGLQKPNPELIDTRDIVCNSLHQNTQILVSGDPDFDRFCVSERIPIKQSSQALEEMQIVASKNKTEWYHYSGCELGIILTEYMIQHSKGNNRAIISTAVSTHMVKHIAECNGVEYYETLTGFKNMCNLSINLTKQDKKVIICFEEAIGYTVGFDGIIINDKCGISTGCVVLQLLNQLYSNKMTLQDELNRIYKKYGYYQYISRSIKLNDLSEATQLLLPIIQDANDRVYPDQILNYQVERVRDLMFPGYDSAEPDKKPKLSLQHTEMLTFFFSKGMLTLRMSGTEPLLKYYIETQNESQEQAEKMLKQIQTFVLKTMKQL